MSEIAYIPENMYLMMMAINAIVIYYSFTVFDRHFYTDIFTSLLSIIISSLLAYNSIIGIGYTQVMSASVQYDNYISTPIAVMMIAIALVMMIVLLAKIIDIIKYTSDQEDMII